MSDQILNNIKDALMKGNRDSVSRYVGDALKSGLEVKDILNNGLIAGMEVIGERFKKSEIFIPEVLISAKAMHAGMAILEPHFAKSGITPLGKVVIGTVKGDLHDIGKNIVSMMLKGSCFEIHDLGIDVSAQKFVDAVKKSSSNLLAMSSLLTTSMGAMSETIRAIDAAGIRSQVKIMVGGAPVTREFAASIGADGYAKDAAVAVDLAKQLVGK